MVTMVLNDGYDDNIGIIVIDPLIGEKEHYNSQQELINFFYSFVVVPYQDICSATT